MLSVAQTKAYREEVVKKSPTIKATTSSQDIFPAPEQLSPLHGIALCDTSVQLKPSFQRLYERK
jgi:hypothetical protein